jgi:hypothetical protein
MKKSKSLNRILKENMIIWAVAYGLLFVFLWWGAYMFHGYFMVVPSAY